MRKTKIETVISIKKRKRIHSEEIFVVLKWNLKVRLPKVEWNDKACRQIMTDEDNRNLAERRSVVRTRLSEFKSRQWRYVFVSASSWWQPPMDEFPLDTGQGLDRKGPGMQPPTLDGRLPITDQLTFTFFFFLFGDKKECMQTVKVSNGRLDRRPYDKSDVMAKNLNKWKQARAEEGYAKGWGGRERGQTGQPDIG